MKNKIGIMTDIETLGKLDNPTIFQVAAISFKIETGEILDSINLKMDITKGDKLRVDGDTLLWWLNTNKELLTELLNAGTLSELELMEHFIAWVQKQKDQGEVTLWGNGILFDNAKLKTKIESLGLVYPIHYKNDRDVRTILALAADRANMTEQEIKDSVANSDEVQHDALDDTKYQIRLVCRCYELLMK